MGDVRLADLLGPLLGADFLYVEGEVLEEQPDLPSPVVHRFWSHRHLWRVERDDGVTFVDGPDGSATWVHGRLSERRPAGHTTGFHLPERLLRPRCAPVWGRPGEDWQLAGDVEVLESGLVRLALQGTHERASERGHLVADPGEGRLHRVSTPDFTWTLTRVGEDPTGDPANLFAVPAIAS